MIDKQFFDEIFPKAKSIQLNSKAEVVALAKKVSQALKEEREKLVKEQQDNTFTTRLFPTSQI